MAFQELAPLGEELPGLVLQEAALVPLGSQSLQEPRGQLAWEVGPWAFLGSSKPVVRLALEVELLAQWAQLEGGFRGREEPPEGVEERQGQEWGME